MVSSGFSAKKKKRRSQNAAFTGKRRKEKKYLSAFLLGLFVLIIGNALFNADIDSAIVVLLK